MDGDLFSDDDEEIIEYISTDFFNRRVEVRKDYLNSLRDKDFQRRFRLSKRLVLIVLDKIKHKLEYKHNNNR